MVLSSEFNIKQLISGGLITNYYCTSHCRHCLYNCSPAWPKKYISANTAATNFQTIKSLGCNAIHIGGGEPLLNPDALLEVLEAASRAEVHIDYVETNSSWYQDPESAITLLGQLKRNGLHTLLVSISPFHNEYIPFAKVKGVMAAAQQVGIRLFPWTDGFLSDLTSMDPDHTHSLSDFESCFGRNYLVQIPNRYWVHLGGRAINTFRNVLPEKSLEHILKESGANCAIELSDTSHFHLDLFENYIPGLCAGLVIGREHLEHPLSADEYPVLHKLYTQGIREFYRWAQERFGYQPLRSNYINKCDLCTEIRADLVKNPHTHFKELQPIEFYTLG